MARISLKDEKLDKQNNGINIILLTFEHILILIYLLCFSTRIHIKNYSDTPLEPLSDITTL